MLEPSETLMPAGGEIEAAMAAARTTGGESLAELSMKSPVLLVFLRHAGCPFCLEALHDLKQQRVAIERSGVRIVLVHMGAEPGSADFFEAQGVGELERISDADQSLYRAFELRRGNVWQLGGPKVWVRLFRALRVGSRVGKPAGKKQDPWQMPGLFLIHQGQVVAAYRHRSQGDRPDYTRMACSLGPSGS